MLQFVNNFSMPVPAGTGNCSRQNSTHAYDIIASYIRQEGHLYEICLALTKTRLISDEMGHLYGKLASYSSFPLINGPIFRQEEYTKEITVY